MSPQRLAITWRGQAVGWMESPTVDMFHRYGRWTPAGPEAENFLTELRHAEESEEEVELLVGEIPATASTPPNGDGVLEVRMRPQ
jgi:hypothetical protein